MLREAQMQLLRWALAVGDGEDHPLPGALATLDHTAVWASGLSAYAGWLLERHHVLVPDDTRDYLRAQRHAVAERSQRFTVLEPKVLRALHAREVGAIPVKGLVLARSVWPTPDVRPMADIDIIVPADRRPSAYAAMHGESWPCIDQSANEDTYLGWPAEPESETIRGESPAHAGKIEIHPGWHETCHGYSIGNTAALLDRANRGDFLGVRCLTLDPIGLCAHTLGHLSAGVIRREARPLHVIDALLTLRALDRSDRIRLSDYLSRVDPRLSAPGLWLVRAADRDTRIVHGVAAGQIRRLGDHLGRVLATTPPARVLRDPSTNVPLNWRMSWARTNAERAAVLQRFAFPPRRELGVGEWGEGTARLWTRRILRGARRTLLGS